MKKATYSIKFPKGKTESVQGYVFDIMGLQFGCCKEQCTFNSSYRWRITELSSGYVFLIGDWDKTRKQCYAAILRLLISALTSNRRAD